MMVSRNAGALYLFLILSAFSVKKSSCQSGCTTYEYKSKFYYTSYGYPTYRRQLISYYKYCSTSCCGYDCCPEYMYTYHFYYNYHNAIRAGAIVGIVIGSLIGLAILISIVAACCIGCRRRQSQSGHCVPAGAQNVSYIHLTQNAVPGQVIVGTTYPQYPYAVQPLGYSYPTTAVTESRSTEGTTNMGFKPDTSAPPPPYQLL